MEDVKIVCKYHAMVDVDDLKPHPRNNNRHSVEQIKAFADRVKKTKTWTEPVKVSKKSGHLIAGHKRTEAAKLLGIKKLPVTYLELEDIVAEIQELTFDNECAKGAELDRHELHLAIEEFGIELINPQELGITDWKFETIESTQIDNRHSVAGQTTEDKVQSSDLRTLLFPVNNDEFVQIVEKLTQIMDQHKLDQMSQALVILCKP
jgi:hypothetical protein